MSQTETVKSFQGVGMGQRGRVHVHRNRRTYRAQAASVEYGEYKSEETKVKRGW